MVDEYLSEREQADQLKNWFKENWVTLVAGAALGLGGLYGYRWWQSHLQQRSAEAEQRFTQMLDAWSANDKDRAMALAAELTGDYAATPYADHTVLVLARVETAAGELDRASARLAELAAEANDPQLKLVARLRLARVQLAQGQFDQALATLDRIDDAAVVARVAELRGDVLHARGDSAGALAAYQAAQAAAAVATPGAAGLVDGELLELKIDQLAAAVPAE